MQFERNNSISLEIWKGDVSFFVSFGYQSAYIDPNTLDYSYSIKASRKIHLNED